MRTWAVLVIAAGAMCVSGCGVPRAAGTLAAQRAALTTVPQDDASVRAQLIDQDAAWSGLAAMLQQQEFGGITGIDPNFKAMVNQTAALAKREHELITNNQDDPAQNKEALQKFEAVWQAANRYLNP